ncbi:MAG: PIG-L family deacetylase [Balneolales bacterium]|nr:PIG-L family deacetylase [Balneolales bacterium]
MATILYIFPHPDDESFGPPAGIAQQISQGHEVYLLTLTKGGATKVRHDLGLSIEEMGEIRYQEMINVAEKLRLTGMTVLDLPDSGLKNMFPQIIEQTVEDHVLAIKPDILVTYAVHGISGFHDHLVSHAVVKRVFCHLRSNGHLWLKRLALYTLGPNSETEGYFKLNNSTEEEIDCIIQTNSEEHQIALSALYCYKTYMETIRKTRMDERIGEPVHFEFFQESFSPPLNSLTEQLRDER